jgi:hypothetical protein
LNKISQFVVTTCEMGGRQYDMVSFLEQMVRQGFAPLANNFEASTKLMGLLVPK